MRVAVAAVVAAATLAAPAFAKGPDVAVACGARQCHTIHGERAVWPLLEWMSIPFASRPAPARAPFYSLTLRDPYGVRWKILFVPDRHAVRIWQSRVPPYTTGVGPYWRPLPPSAERTFHRVVGRIAPKPAPPAWSLVG